MKPVTRLDHLYDRQAEAACAIAAPRALAALEAMAAVGLTAWVVGSLARDRFTAFSDVDFLIEGGQAEWDKAVPLIERCMGDLDVDILRSARLSPPERTHLLKDALDAPRLRARLDQARIASDGSHEARGR